MPNITESILKDRLENAQAVGSPAEVSAAEIALLKYQKANLRFVLTLVSLISLFGGIALVITGRC